MRKKLMLLVLVIFSIALLSGQESYRLPPREVIDIVDAPPTPMAVMDHSGRYLALVEYRAMPPLKMLVEPYFKLAGLRVNPKTNSERTLLQVIAITLTDLKTREKLSLPLPAGYTFDMPRWSYDDHWLVIPAYTEEGAELWAAEIPALKVKKVLPQKLNLLFNQGYFWLPDNHRMLVSTIPQGRGSLPVAPLVPKGPRIQETSRKFSKVQTYQDLLKTNFDETLFDYHGQSQMVEVDVVTGNSQLIGQPGIYTSVDPSPDGNLLLITRIHRPYSYNVPYELFPQTQEVWNRKGEIKKTLAELPLAEEIPMNGVRTGPRRIRWQPLQPATLIWVEALDKGDPKLEAEFRDQIYSWDVPFQDAPRPVVKLKNRFQEIGWLQKKGIALLSDYDWKKEWRTVYLFDFTNPAADKKKVMEYNIKDDYSNPGNPVYTVTPRGEDLIISKGDWIYLRGPGASPEGERPFLDRFNLHSGAKKRIFHSQKDKYQSFIAFLGASRIQTLIRSESKRTPPNYYIFNLKSGKELALTDFKDPAPQLTGIKKELVRYKRADGLQLSGMLYFPPSYKQGQRLPMVLWAYPLEYTDTKTAGQVRGSENRFTFFRGSSQLFFLTQGYVVLDNAQMPVVGDPETKNDTYLEQIVSSARAAIDYLDQRGLIDPKRVGVGGHSYGAFMTANLLAHSSLFTAGIARSGAYNRTLTPFGFQTERRSLWEAPDIYIKVSPFMVANKLKTPILLIHGEEDNNTGTFPIQSERFYAALKGFGATARLVILPFESHGYQARESVLHVLAEMFDWFDQYVKNKK